MVSTHLLFSPLLGEFKSGHTQYMLVAKRNLHLFFQVASHSHKPLAPAPVESLEPESWKFVKWTFWTTKLEFWFRLVQSFSIRWFLLVPAVNFPGCTLVFLFTDVGVLFSLCSFNVYWCWKNTNQKWRVMIWLGFHTAVRVFVWACSCSWSRGLYFLSYKGLVSSPLSRFLSMNQSGFHDSCKMVGSLVAKNYLLDY